MLFIGVLNIMVILRVIRDGNNVVSVEVPLDKLKNSEYFNGLMTYCDNDNPLLFPPQYHDVFDLYCKFITCNITTTDTPIKNCKDIVITHQQLSRGFELCHYLDDQTFFTYLTTYLLDHWTTHHDIINNLSDNIQRDIYLRCPWSCIPDKYSKYVNPQPDSNINININININANANSSQHWISRAFLYAWVKNNNNKIMSIDSGSVIFNTLCTFFHNDDNNSDNNSDNNDINIYGSNKSLYSFSCTMTKDRWTYTHGVMMSFCMTDKDGNQQLNKLSHYDHGTLSGLNIEWYPKGTVYRHMQFQQGMRTYQKTFHSNGNVMDEMFWCQGKECGTWQIWYPSGRLKWCMPFLDGKRHGCHRQYFDIVCDNHNTINGDDSVNNIINVVNDIDSYELNHTVKYEFNFDHDKEVGVFKAWYYLPDEKRRQLKYKHYYLNHNGSTVYREYDKGGKLIYNFSSDANDKPPQLKDKQFKCIHHIDEEKTCHYEFC